MIFLLRLVLSQRTDRKVRGWKRIVKKKRIKEKDMVNGERVADVFKTLVEIDSVSRNEGAVAKALTEIFESLGGEVLSTGPAQKVGGEAGNLIARFKGTEQR